MFTLKHFFAHGAKNVNKLNSADAGENRANDKMYRERHTFNYVVVTFAGFLLKTQNTTINNRP